MRCSSFTPQKPLLLYPIVISGRPVFIKLFTLNCRRKWLGQESADCFQHGAVIIRFRIYLTDKCLPLFPHSAITIKSHNLFKLCHRKIVFSVCKGFPKSFRQYLAVKIKFISKIINIVIVFHPAGKLHQAEDCVNFFSNSRFNGISINCRCNKIIKLSRDFSFFLLWHNDITNTKMQLYQSLSSTSITFITFV